MTDIIFALPHRATDFVTRDVGRLLRADLLTFESQIDPVERITVDLTGVNLLTPSFVDEFFGRTAAEMGLERFKARFRISGISSEFRSLINNVVRNRLMMQNTKPRSREGLD